MLKEQRYRNRSTQCVDAPIATVISSVQKTQYPGHLQLTAIIQCVHNLSQQIHRYMYTYISIHVYPIYWTIVNVT